MTAIRTPPVTVDNLPRAGREGFVIAVVAALGAVVVALWWHDTPPGSIHSASTALIAAGDVTALVGSYLVLVEVVLMSRVPWLDRLIGMDRLAVWHRQVGQYSIGLLVGHALLTVWGYGLADHVNPAVETKRVVLTYPDVLMATVGLALLVAVGVASARAARQRLSYQTWYFIHLYTYLAIALSFAHQLATGNDFATHTANRAFWVLLSVAAVAIVIGWRVVVPVRDATRRQLRVANVVREGPDAISIYVTGNLADMQVEPGQFFLWRFLTREGWWQAHPYSLSAAPNGKWLRLTAKEVGDHSRQLARLQPGTRVMAEGPYGNFTRRRQRRPGVAMIAGGIGITPLRAMFETMPGDIVLVYRASSADDVVLAHELDEIAHRRGARVHYVVGSRHQVPDALTPERLQALVPDMAFRDVFVCGPAGMTHATRHALRRLGVPNRRIHVEEFEY